jgi:hypothetical protein
MKVRLEYQNGLVAYEYEIRPEQLWKVSGLKVEGTYFVLKYLDRDTAVFVAQVIFDISVIPHTVPRVERAP